ncbi:hypothetical protein OESDEN_08480 [Oesophagostomum dentatum]|uniref:Uncharacterized protein n=1 Tax=Oesophagostomum dentatum TaxID=61180 RepID=A0A0B1T372_OESDE|nr:hypothetical protein OESDEN_08480 [Oesophagostomum dentatum]
MTPLVLKKRAYDICVTPAVLYGENGEEDARTYLDRRSSERIRALTKLRDWSDEAAGRKLQWAQKIRNMKEEEWAKALTTWILYNYIRRKGGGRPPLRWRDEITKNIGRDWWSMTNERIFAYCYGIRI